ncbi:MAG TPA: hypothetical protein VF092_21485 [Longimicrobium sp.]
MYDRADLARLWREHAGLLRRYGAEAQAAALEQCAADVEAEERERVNACVTLEEAVELTGFSRSHLRRLWREGDKVRRAGTEDAPLFYESELPRKPGYTPKNKRLAPDIEQPVNSLLQVARAIVKGEQ